VTRVESWSDIPVGALVTLRRGPLTGEQIERTKAWTASGPFYSESGRSVIRVQIAGSTVTYPLERVSLGWEERPPAVTIAAAIEPTSVEPPMNAVDWLAIVGAAYFVALGLAAILGAVLP
jgi:hypothetical protein